MYGYGTGDSKNILYIDIEIFKSHQDTNLLDDPLVFLIKSYGPI